MAFPDSVKAWTAAVEHGLIEGDPAYYYDGVATSEEYHHALIVSILEAHGIDWQGTSEPPVDPPVDPPSGFGDGKAFGDRPSQTAVKHYQGQDGLVIEDLFFDGTGGKFQVNQSNPSNNHVCIMLTDCTNVIVRNVDFQNVSQPFAIFGGSDITIEDNRCDGITGPHTRLNVQNGNFLQTVNGPSRVTVRNNMIRGGDTEDIISLYSARDSIIENNHIDGTGWSSDSGTGIILSDGGGQNNKAIGNILFNPGQVGVAAAGGTGSLMEGNIVYGPKGIPGSNVGMYVANYSSGPYGDHHVVGNRVWYWNQGGGVLNGFWTAGGVVEERDNNWADSSLKSGPGHPYWDEWTLLI